MAMITLVVEDRSAKPNLGMASTADLLEEVAIRMEHTQNSTSGREIAVMCREALLNLAPGILAYKTLGGWK